jgi:hypothetical protein
MPKSQITLANHQGGSLHSCGAQLSKQGANQYASVRFTLVFKGHTQYSDAYPTSFAYLAFNFMFFRIIKEQQI